MEEGLMGGGVAAAFEVEDEDGFESSGAAHAYEYEAPTLEAGDDGQSIDPIIREAFAACMDMDNDDGRVSAEELYAVLLAMGCPLTLREVSAMMERVEQSVRAGLLPAAGSTPGAGAKPLAPFERGFHLRIEKKLKSNGTATKLKTNAHGDRGRGCCSKSKAAVALPCVAVHSKLEHALYRAVDQAAHSARRIGVHGQVEQAVFDGVVCQFGRAVNKTDWCAVKLELDDASGLLSISRDSGDLEHPSQLTSQVSLKDCSVNRVKRPRRGYPHTWRVNTIQPDAVPGHPLRIPGSTKFTLATSTAEEMSSWVARMQPFAAHPEPAAVGSSSSGGEISVVDGQLDVFEFQHLIKHELVSVLPGNWRTRCRKIVKLRRAFLSADLDGDRTIRKDELSTVVLASDVTTNPSPADVDELWALLDPERKGEVRWFDFLRSMTLAEEQPVVSRLLSLDKPNRWELISLLIDVPVCKETERELLADMSGVERRGVQFLETMQRPPCQEETFDRLKRAAHGNLRQKTPEQMKRIYHIRWWLQWWLFWIAFFTNTAAGFFENYLMWARNTDSTGMVNGFYLVCNNCSDPDSFGMNLLECQLPYIKDSCDITGVQPTESYTDYVEETVEGLGKGQKMTMAPEQVRETYGKYICGCEGGFQVSSNTAVFWGLNTPMIIVTVLLEIYLMGFAALRASCLIAAEYEFRLTPLNQSRAFVARSFIRATFEMGQPKSSVLGVDPEAKSNFQLKLEATVLGLIWALKVLLLGLLIKLTLWAPFMPMVWYTWIGSYAPVVASMFWDALIGSVIMDQVENRAHGVTSGTELLNELLDEFTVCHEDEDEAAEADLGYADATPQQQTGAGGQGKKPVLSTLAKISVVRAIGVAIVENGTMYPPMELLLRHAIQYFDLASLVRVESAELDSVDRLKHELPMLPLREQRLVACVHLLTMLLDGTLSIDEASLIEEIYAQPEEREREFGGGGGGGGEGLITHSNPSHGSGSGSSSSSSPQRASISGNVQAHDSAAGPPNLVNNLQDLVPRMLHLSYRYRKRQFITADDLAHTIGGADRDIDPSSAGSTGREIEYPFWRNCCGYGVNVFKCQLFKVDKPLKPWSFRRYGEELWNVMTFKLV